MSCPTGKRRHADRGLALLTLDTIQRKFDGTCVQKVETRAYRCPKCAGWHLTSSASRSTRRAK